MISRYFFGLARIPTYTQGLGMQDDDHSDMKGDFISAKSSKDIDVDDMKSPLISERSYYLAFSSPGRTHYTKTTHLAKANKYFGM